MVAENPILESSTDRVALELNIRLLGTREGEPLENELPPERLSLLFDNVPPGLLLWPEKGGTVTGDPGGSFTFTGSEEQASNLSLVRSGPGLPSTIEIGQYTVSISGITFDNGSVLETPVLDKFVLYVKRTVETTTLVVGEEQTGARLLGTAGNDILLGTDGDDILDGSAGRDVIQGGPGSDILTGGNDSDLFQWSPSDLGESMIDSITDFKSGVAGDKLDLTGLFTVDRASAPEGLISNYVQIQEDKDSTTVLVDIKGTASGFVALVKLDGLTNLDLETMLSQGNIMI